MRVSKSLSNLQETDFGSPLNEAFGKYLTRLTTPPEGKNFSDDDAQRIMRMATTTHDSLVKLLSYTYEEGVNVQDQMASAEYGEAMAQLRVRWCSRSDLDAVVKLQGPQHLPPFDQQEILEHLGGMQTIGIVAENPAPAVEPVEGFMMYDLLKGEMAVRSLTSVPGPRGLAARMRLLNKVMDKLTAEGALTPNRVLSCIADSTHHLMAQLADVLLGCQKELPAGLSKRLTRFQEHLPQSPLGDELRLLVNRLAADPTPVTAAKLHRTLVTLQELLGNRHEYRDRPFAEVHPVPPEQLQHVTSVLSLPGNAYSSPVYSSPAEEHVFAETDKGIAGLASWHRPKLPSDALVLNAFAAQEHPQVAVAEALAAHILSVMRKTDALRLTIDGKEPLKNGELRELAAQWLHGPFLVPQMDIDAILSRVRHGQLQSELRLLLPTQPAEPKAAKKKADDKALRQAVSLRTVVDIADELKLPLDAPIPEDSLASVRPLSVENLPREAATIYDRFSGRPDLTIVPETERLTHTWTLVSAGSTPAVAMEWRDDEEARQRRIYRCIPLNRHQLTKEEQIQAVSALLANALAAIRDTKKPWSLARFVPEE